MSGTRPGGQAAARKNIEKRADFYAYIGAMGGRKGRTGGFASTVVGADGLTGRERARIQGAMGGRISRRTKKSSVVVETVEALESASNAKADK